LLLGRERGWLFLRLVYLFFWSMELLKMMDG
jgi:hypothetical protein